MYLNQLSAPEKSWKSIDFETVRPRKNLMSCRGLIDHYTQPLQFHISTALTAFPANL